MKKLLIIFGAGDIAQLAHYYFSADSNYEVVAFTVDAAYVGEGEFCGLPVVPFEELLNHYSPEKHELFVALSYSKLNQVRTEKYLAAKALGYRIASYISSHATLLNDGRIGENCFILEDNTIQPFVSIGNNVTLWSGNHIGHHSTVHDHCFIASLRDHIKIGKKCVIGAGALILADAEPEGVYIGQATERAKVPSTRLRNI
jgi:acetyltransferase-like isoleucine patch superfamily enzyme